MTYEELLTLIYKLDPQELKQKINLYITEDDKMIKVNNFHPEGVPDRPVTHFSV